MDNNASKNMISRPVNFSSMSGGLPSNVNDGGISSYINMVKNIPHLSPEEEYDLAIKVQKEHDLDAAEKLIKSNLFLVVATAFEYKGYGLPISDIISEGNIGLMKAVKKFDPQKGFKLSTYALWWIRATINEFILSSWSLVKIGTAAAQKKLFFSLKRIKAKLGIYHDSDMTPAEVKNVAKELEVAETDVVEMNRRANRDSSLNKIISDDGGNDNEVINLLVSNTPNSEEIIGENETQHLYKQMLHNAIEKLNDRERIVIQKRKLTDTPSTLEDLSIELEVSKERIRQIEAKAMEKLATALFEEKNRLFSHSTTNKDKKNADTNTTIDTTATEITKA